MFPVLLQAVSMISVTAGRIRDFLILPELKGEVKEQPAESSDAIVVVNGKFKWGYESEKDLFILFFLQLYEYQYFHSLFRDPPQIPLTLAEKQKIDKEKKKRALEAKEAERKKKEVFLDVFTLLILLLRNRLSLPFYSQCPLFRTQKHHQTRLPNRIRQWYSI
jgi:hypothetical protein